MVEVIETPEKMELFGNLSYVRILSILRQGEFNIKEIHKRFNEDYEDKKTLSTMYRYMEKLAEHDLVFVSREELKRKHIIEGYYSRTAMFFVFKDMHKEESIKAASELLQKVYTLDTEHAEKLTQILKEYHQDMFQNDVTFYETYGEKILTVEKEHGYKILKGAIHLILEILYYRKNPELFDRIFAVLEKESL